VSDTFLDLMLRDMEITEVGPDEPFKPMAKLEEGDHEVGEATEAQKKLFIMAQKLAKMALDTKSELYFAPDEGARAKLAVRFNEFVSKHNVFMDILWVSVKEEFKLWDKPSIGLRKNWIVVWNEPQVPTLRDLLGDAFG